MNPFYVPFPFSFEEKQPDIHNEVGETDAFLQRWEHLLEQQEQFSSVKEHQKKIPNLIKTNQYESCYFASGYCKNNKQPNRELNPSLIRHSRPFE
jgi:hypothetical protein